MQRLMRVAYLYLTGPAHNEMAQKHFLCALGYRLRERLQVYGSATSDKMLSNLLKLNFKVSAQLLYTHHHGRWLLSAPLCLLWLPTEFWLTFSH